MASRALITAAALAAPVVVGASPWMVVASPGGAATLGRPVIGAPPLGSLRTPPIIAALPGRLALGAPPIAGVAREDVVPFPGRMGRSLLGRFGAPQERRQLAPPVNVERRPGHPGLNKKPGKNYNPPKVWVPRNPALENCPGMEPNKWGSGKCDQFSVCAQLLKDDGTPLEWADGKNFWETTGAVPPKKWESKLKNHDNTGDSTCVGMWKVAAAIQKAGCENVRIRCDATRVKLVQQYLEVPGRFDIYTEGHPLGKMDSEKVIGCFREKCYEPMYKDWPARRQAMLDKAMAASTALSQVSPTDDDAGAWINDGVVRVGAVAATGGLVGAVMALVVARRRRASSASLEPLLG